MTDLPCKEVRCPLSLLLRLVGGQYSHVSTAGSRAGVQAHLCSHMLIRLLAASPTNCFCRRL